jgi:hypothetical protein
MLDKKKIAPLRGESRVTGQKEIIPAQKALRSLCPSQNLPPMSFEDWKEPWQQELLSRNSLSLKTRQWAGHLVVGGRSGTAC